jgi:hypothetical protein
MMWNGRSIFRLTPYVAIAAVAAFGLSYGSQPFVRATEAARIETPSTARMVDRTHKGDRLSIERDGGIEPSSRMRPPVTLRPAARPRIPDGCDGAFGPLITIEQGNFAARCVI